MIIWIIKELSFYLNEYNGQVALDKNYLLRNHPSKKIRLTRRQFIKSTVAGTAAYIAPSLGLRTNTHAGTIKSRVVTIRHEEMITPDERIDKISARHCLDEALLLLTQKENVKEAWEKIFPELKSQDTIGLKVNSVNPKCPTHPEIVYSIAESLIDSLGINPNNIIIWDRSTTELKRTGYAINKSDKGIRCFGTIENFNIIRWSLDQMQDETGGIGYDKTTIDMGRGKTSHLSKILTQMCTYLINVPVLKDHGLAGITLSLKNHYGTIDNPGECHDNSCDPYITKINSVPHIKNKTKLIICDAAFGVYDGGAMGTPQWKHKSILAATDPVALDYTGMKIINAQRKLNNLYPITDMAIHLTTSQKSDLGTCNPNNIQLKEAILA